MPVKAGTVAFYFHRMGNSGGGAERMICQLANALTERGFEVHLVTWDMADAVTFYPLDKAVHWHRLGFSQGWMDKVRRTQALAKVLRKNNVQLLIGFVMSGDKTVYAATRLSGVRLIAAERNAPAMYYLRYKWYQRWLSFLLLHLCDRIVVQFSGYVPEYPSSLRSRTTAIPNPVTPVTMYARPDVPDKAGQYILLAVGRLDDVQKGFECLVNSFSRIAKDHPDWILKIIGDGPQLHKLRRQISDLELDKRVFISPSTPDIAATYCGSHLFVIPSRWEGFPNVLAEAMCHGLPAVGFRQAAGVNQLIEDGVSGWLADGLDNDKNLSKILSEAMTDVQQRMQRGQNAIKQMKKYEPEKQYEQWVSLLSSLINRDR